MAPTMKQSGKGDAGASSSSVNVDMFRFWDTTAVQNYALLMNKSISREMGYDLEHPR